MEILQPPTDPIGALCYLPAACTGGALRPPAMRGGPLVITIGSSTAITSTPGVPPPLRAELRAAIALLQSRYRMDRTLADTYLSVAIDFNIAQVVDLLKGVHAGSG